MKFLNDAFLLVLRIKLLIILYFVCPQFDTDLWKSHRGIFNCLVNMMVLFFSVFLAI